MFWNRFKRTREVEVEPEWAKDLEKVRGVIQQAPPGAAIDPEVIARVADLPLGKVLALLQVLTRQHKGNLELRVVDDRGHEIGAFKKLSEIPESVEDQFGDVTRVVPENVELVFRASR